MTFNLIVFPTQKEYLCILYSYEIPCFSHCALWYDYLIVKKADSFFTTYKKKIVVIIRCLSVHEVINEILSILSEVSYQCLDFYTVQIRQ